MACIDHARPTSDADPVSMCVNRQIGDFSCISDTVGRRLPAEVCRIESVKT